MFGFLFLKVNIWLGSFLFNDKLVKTSPTMLLWCVINMCALILKLIFKMAPTNFCSNVQMAGEKLSSLENVNKENICRK